MENDIEKKLTDAEAIEKNKALLREYPFLKPYGADTWEDDPYDYSWTMLDLVCLGWQKMFLEYCSKIKEELTKANVPLDQFYFCDIKEKWGSLRVSVGGPCPDEVDKLVEAMETDSLLYCPSCGKPSKVVTSGYILYICEDCAKEAKLNHRPLTAEDIPYYTYYKTDENGNETKERREVPHRELFLAQWTGGKEG